MKKKGFSIILTLVFIFHIQVNACSIIEIPLRKEFRRAKTIFTGRVVNIADFSPSEDEKILIPTYWQNSNYPPFSKITFEITHNWKHKTESKEVFISVSEEFCGCYLTDLRKFKEGKEYLIISSKKRFISVCESEEQTNDLTKKKIHHFDSFWFRTWTKVYPF